MIALVKQRLFDRGLLVEGSEYLCLEIEGEMAEFGVVQLGEEFICYENREAKPRVLRLPLEELRLYTLKRERFYALLAADLGISGQVSSIAAGVWELGRWASGEATAKVLFVEAGVNDAELRLLLHTYQFPAICVLCYGSIPLPPNIGGQVIVCGRVEVVDGRMVTDAFLDLAAIHIPRDPRHPSILDLSNQMAEGFESIRREVIQEVVATNEMLKELEANSGSAVEFMTQLVAGFGSDKSMADLFMRLLATRPDGKPLSYADVGNQMGITRQAVEAQFRKMRKKFPTAHRHLRSLRARAKTTQFSAISPKERRKEGIDSAYDYDAD